MQYESKIWDTADLLRGAGIKTSDFPKYMMPFFALVMVESRLLRMLDEKKEELGDEDLDDILEEIQEENFGYNDLLLKDGITLAEIGKNDTNLKIDFDGYLKAYDAETRILLGVERGPTEEKYLDITGISGLLRKKGILLDFVRDWGAIDLQPYSNSEITTLEEHIKRRWADISAETAGEQYTPDDVIHLIAELILSKVERPEGFINIYDPTCGGGNMLFGVEDVLRRKFGDRTATFGQDWNDALYALAKIESRFREDSRIEHGNTLTDMKFSDIDFEVVVANPPYGVDWKSYRKAIQDDKTDRFVALPSISDGQLLFTQHIVHHVAPNGGIGVVVHNGSTLFSGDAGSGESNIRKHFFESDFVEAIIQLPTDEFFNTGIHTYLWIFNKNKASDRVNKVMLINASELYMGLGKNRGKKRKEIPADQRQLIVETLHHFKDTDFAKVFDRDYFFYNKQAILLQNLDDLDRSFQEHLPWKTSRFEPYEKYQVKAIKLTPLHIQQGDISFAAMEITDFDAEQYADLRAYYDEAIKPLVNQLDYKEKDLVVTASKQKKYWFDQDKNTIIESVKGKETEKGCSKILVKASFKKATKTRDARIVLQVELTADNEKDYEVIPYSRDPEQNQRNISDFMAKYITRPFEYLDNTVGVEINFNKVFYQPEELRPVRTILADLADLEAELKKLEGELQL